MDEEFVGGGCDVLGLLPSTVGADEGGLLVWAIPDRDVVRSAAATPLKPEVLELEEHLEPVWHLDLPSAICIVWVLLRVVG